MINNPEMTARDVIKFIQMLDQHSIKVVIDGGWVWMHCSADKPVFMMIWIWRFSIRMSLCCVFC